MSHPRFKFLCQTQSFLLNDWVLINVANKKETGYGFLIPNLFPFCMIPYSYKHVKKMGQREPSHFITLSITSSLHCILFYH